MNNDKELIERLALEAAKEYLKFKLGNRKGFDIYDLDEETAELEKEIEQECADALSRFLAAYLAERGAEAVAGYINSRAAQALREGMNCATTITKHEAIDDDVAIFLAPQPAIPEGYALYSEPALISNAHKEWEESTVLAADDPSYDTSCGGWKSLLKLIAAAEVTK